MPPTGNCWARSNSACATTPTTWRPPPTRPVSKARKKGYLGSSAVCPRCGQDAGYVEARPHDVFTAHGTLRHTRAYYHCPGCGQGHCPDDHHLGLDGHWSPTLQPAVTLLGALVPFATASDLLRQLTG